MDDAALGNPVVVHTPTFEHHHSGLGVNTSKPRISWRFSQPDTSGVFKGWQQVAYELEVTRSPPEEPETFRADSNRSVCVPWPTRPLQSREAASVRVRCLGAGNNSEARWTEWSSPAIVEAALLLKSDWTAQMIAASEQGKAEDGSLKPIRLVKRFFLRSKTIACARLYVTAYGCYAATINGQPVGDHCMAPGWQSYNHRLHYQVFDITKLLQQENTIAADVAAGWYASKLAWAKGRRCFYGEYLALLAQVMIDYDDGTTETIASDETWMSCNSTILSSEIQNGETFQQSSEIIPNAQTALPVRALPVPTAQLISPDTPPVRVTQKVFPIDISRSPSGKLLLDFGQNLVGRLRVMSLKKPAGSVVAFSHAEVLENGELGRRPLRGAKCTDTIICDGSMLQSWAPKFTFHGFRYVEVTGWAPEDQHCPLTLESIAAEVMHSDMERAGWFTCSNELVNKLHDNAIWSMRGNFLSVPTDCPQRDERLGWTGDIQVFASSANFLYSTTGMLGNWLDDLAVEQAERGGVPPFVVPDVITMVDKDDTDFWPHLPNAVWDDVAVLLPWALFTSSGDHFMLEKQYASMKSWIDQGIRRGADGLWDDQLYQLGDWLDPIAPPSEPGNGRTDGVVVADEYLVQVTKKLAQAAELLGRAEDAVKYTSDYQRLLQIFRDKYVTKSGLVLADTQTALALAVIFDLLETPQQRIVAGERLARAVRLQQFRVATGFAGTPIVLHALSRTGNPQLAYRMLLEQRCPSWMYAVAMGATTIWERWDSMLPDGSINPGEMTSFNHYALGSVVNWLHEVVGGLSPLEPGYKVFEVKPVLGGDITSAQVSHLSPYGMIRVDWTLHDEVLALRLLVPPNTTAVVTLPSWQEQERVGSGEHTFSCTFIGASWPPQAIMPPFWPQPAPLLATAESSVSKTL